MTGRPAAPYRDAARLDRQFPLITVQGGDEAKSGACQGLSAHGFYGRERETIAAIKRWSPGRPYPTFSGGAN